MAIALASGDEHRSGNLLEEVLQLVDIANHARQQIATAIVGQSGRCQRLQPCKESACEVPEQSERHVVRDDPLGVAHEGARDAENAHQIDGSRQFDQKRMQRRRRDEIGGRRQQAGVGRDRQHTEEDRERDTPAIGREKAEQSRHRLQSAAAGL